MGMAYLSTIQDMTADSESEQFATLDPAVCLPENTLILMLPSFSYALFHPSLVMTRKKAATNCMWCTLHFS